MLPWVQVESGIETSTISTIFKFLLYAQADYSDQEVLQVPRDYVFPTLLGTEHGDKIWPVVA
jgi:hypothetical protein